jgi:hypothetical protein
VDPVNGFIEPGSAPFKDSDILAPKLADLPFWGKATPPPLNLDPVYLIWINSYFVLFKMKYSYLETRSHRVNKSFIIVCPIKLKSVGKTRSLPMMHC